jgi:DNA-binding NarL/FixJ family response regulator
MSAIRERIGLDDPLCSGAGLTDKQAKAARLLLKGMENQEIARAMGVELTAVKSYMSALFHKFKVPTDGRIKRIVLIRKLLCLE